MSALPSIVFLPVVVSLAPSLRSASVCLPPSLRLRSSPPASHASSKPPPARGSLRLPGPTEGDSQEAGEEAGEEEGEEVPAWEEEQGSWGARRQAVRSSRESRQPGS